MALSPTGSRSSGGSAAPITRAQYDIALAGVAPGVLTKLPFVLNYGTALLDLTSPTNPTPVVSGTYSFAATVSISGLIAARVIWKLLLVLDEDDFAGTMVAITTVTNQDASTLPVTFPFYVPAGSPCFVQVQHDGNIAAADFNGHVFVQRLS